MSDVEAINDECPVCLEVLKDDTSTMYMPGCNHRIHVACAMAYARRGDTRCPICRHESVEDDVAEEEDAANEGQNELSNATDLLLEELEDRLQERVAEVRRHAARRARIIRKDPKLYHMRNNIRIANTEIRQLEKDMLKYWSHTIRTLWKTDAVVQQFQRDRRRQQQRIYRLNRSMNSKLETIMGESPELSITVRSLY